MGKATIISHIGEGLYEVDIHVDPDRVNEEIEQLESLITRLEENKALLEQEKIDAEFEFSLVKPFFDSAFNAYQACLLVNGADKSCQDQKAAMTEIEEKYYLKFYDVQYADNAISKTQDQIDAAAIRVEYLQQAERGLVRKNVWCASIADRDSSQPETGEWFGHVLKIDPGVEVSTIDIIDFENGYEQVIAPPDVLTQQPVLFASGYGLLSPAVAEGVAGDTYNRVMWEASEQWQPLYRKGIVTAKNKTENTLTVQLANQNGLTNTNSPQPSTGLVCDVSYYRNQNCRPFKIGDCVIVQMGDVVNDLFSGCTVIGFCKNPRAVKIPESFSIVRKGVPDIYYSFEWNSGTESYDIIGTGNIPKAGMWVHRNVNGVITSCMPNGEDYIENGTFFSSEWALNYLFQDGVSLSKPPLGVVVAAATMESGTINAITCEVNGEFDMDYHCYQFAGGSWSNLQTINNGGFSGNLNVSLPQHEAGVRFKVHTKWVVFSEGSVAVTDYVSADIANNDASTGRLFTTVVEEDGSLTKVYMPAEAIYLSKAGNYVEGYMNTSLNLEKDYISYSSSIFGDVRTTDYAGSASVEFEFKIGELSPVIRRPYYMKEQFPDTRMNIWYHDGEANITLKDYYSEATSIYYDVSAYGSNEAFIRLRPSFLSDTYDDFISPPQRLIAPYFYNDYIHDEQIAIFEDGSYLIFDYTFIDEEQGITRGYNIHTNLMPIEDIVAAIPDFLTSENYFFAGFIKYNAS